MGANAQTSVPTFTAGDVLTAANMNISARTGVPVFADTTARDAGFGGTGEKTLAEGQLCYVENLTAANQIQYYNGTSWVSLQDRAVQIFQVSTTASQTISTSTYTDLTSLSLTITPTSASNKILLTYSTMAEKSAGNASNALNIRFVRDSTTIATWAYHMFTNSLLQMLAQGAWTYVDSPASTSAITYKIQGANQNNGAQVNVQSQGGPGQFIVMEIVA